MKALVLSGGKGTRLRPFTFSQAKQLVPVANRPILGYVLDGVRQLDITDIVVIVAPETHASVEDYVLKNEWGFKRIDFVIQQPLGLAHAIMVSRQLLGNDDFVMCLGDNLLGENLEDAYSLFDSGWDAFVILKDVADPRQFGVAEITNDKLISIEEKPARPKSKYAVIGTYFFNSKIHEIVKTLNPSARGELEITDAINGLIKAGHRVGYKVTNSWWLDTGKKDDIIYANRRIILDYRSVSVSKKAKIVSSTVKQSAVDDGVFMLNSSCYLTSIGKDSNILNATLDNCVVMEGAKVSNVRLKNSLVGRNAQIHGGGHNGEIQVSLGDYSEINLNNRGLP